MGLFKKIKDIMEPELTEDEARMEAGLPPKLPEERPEGVEEKELCSFEECSQELIDKSTCAYCGKGFCKDHEDPLTHDCQSREPAEALPELPLQAPAPGEEVEIPVPKPTAIDEQPEIPKADAVLK